MAADIRCPMCGKLNPAEAETCLFCEARLKPQWQENSASGGDSPEGDEPDWLRTLRADEPGGKKPDPGAKGPDPEIPDWLARLRQKAGEPEKPSGLFQDDDDEETPDWMKDDQPGETTSSEFGNSDDWLSRLGEKDAADDASSGASFDITGSEPGGDPDAGEVDMAGWLANLGNDTSSDLSENQAGALPPASTPLFDDFSGDETIVGQNPTSAESASDQEDDWLSQLNFNEPAASEPQTPAETPDWGSRLFADEPADQPSASAEGMDWLRDFGTETPAEPADQMGTDQPSAPEQTGSGSGWGLTGWLNQQTGQDEPEESPQPELPDTPVEGGLPDWLGGVAGAAAYDTPSEDQESTIDAMSFADEAASFGEAGLGDKPEFSTAAEDETPSWMLEDETFATPGGQSTPQAEDENGPDWLAGGTVISAGQPQAEQTDEDSIPAWMREEASDVPEPAPSAPSGEEQVPDWLAGLGGDQPEAAQPERAEDETLGEEEQALPAWLSGSFNSLETSGEAQSPREAEEQPDFTFSPFSMINDEEPSAPPAPVQAAAEEASPSMEAEQPDWLQSLNDIGREETGAEVSAVSGKGTGPLPFIDEGLPGWMSDLKGQPPAEEPTPALIPVEEYPSNNIEADQPFDIDLPDWLGEEGRQQGAQEKNQSDEPGSAELAQAELPSWVAAMRPVETAIQGDAGAVDTDQHVEKAGPLSGLRGVLPAEDRVINYRKLPAYSVKLRVSEKQRGHAGLLDSLVGQETQPLALAAAPSQAPQLLQRALVALFLLLAISGALVAKLQLVPVPTYYPPEVLNLYDQVQALAADQTVLLAVDYEPGLSGEMWFASSMVIDHLMERNVQMAVVSTVPTGPAMADSLLQQVQEYREDYDRAGRVENLGYLPGGTISLVEFVRNPRGSTPKTTDGQNAWEQPALAGVSDIQSFASIIVITDRAEVGRDWIEQVQPYLGDVPLLIVSSAQAAPLLEPYVESQQVQGMVSGLMGGVLYGQHTGRQSANPALGHYGAYQVGALLGFILVLVGAIFSAVVSLATRNKKNAEK